MLKSAIFFHKRRVMSVIIFRYLCRQVLRTLLATCLVLMLIFVANQFIHYLNDAASGKVTLRAVVLVSALQVPILFSYILPMSLFFALLFTLGRLSVDHELVVLYACGVSRAQLLRQLCLIALIVSVVDGVLMLGLEPRLFGYRSEIVQQAVEQATLEKVLPGRFQALGTQGQVMYVGSGKPESHQFNDVFLAIRANQDDQADQVNSRWQVLSSQNVVEKQLGKLGSFFVFNHGYRYNGTPGENDYEVMQFQEYWSRLPVPVISLAGRYSAMPTATLWQNYSNDRYAAAEWQWRFVNVLACLIFTLIALPLGEINPRQGKFARLLPGILLYVVYANLMFAGKSWIQTGKISPTLGLWWIPGLFILITVVLYVWQFKWFNWFNWFARKRA